MRIQWHLFPAICLGFIVLGGCGASSNVAEAGTGGVPAAAEPPGFQSPKSRAETSSQDLLYISGEDGSVYVYSYPQRKFISTLANLNAGAFGECTDSSGDVFITTASQSFVGTIFEYAHGGTSPVQALSDPGLPNGCAIDPTSGNLAVANIYDPTNPYGEKGDVAIYPGAQGNPSMYYANNAELADFFFCGYDGAGNLFVTAQDAYNAGDSLLLRLPVASNTFQLIGLNTKLHGQSSVQRDGQNLTVSSSVRGKPLTLYRLEISGSSGVVVRTTNLASSKNIYNGQVLVHGRTAMALGPYKRGYQSAFFWAYPKGGDFRSRIRRVGNVKQALWGIAISAAQAR